MYTYRARVVRVIDGDTVVLDIDLGFDIHHIKSCRLWGINAYELRDKKAENRALAKDGRSYLESILVGDVTIESKELDKYGRPLVIIWDNPDDIRSVNQKMLKNDLAVSYLDPKNRLGNTEPDTAQ